MDPRAARKVPLGSAGTDDSVAGDSLHAGSSPRRFGTAAHLRSGKSQDRDPRAGRHARATRGPTGLLAAADALSVALRAADRSRAQSQSRGDSTTNAGN